jgi:hypothetical protein
VANNRLITLYREYIATVDSMYNGNHTTAEIRQLDSERILLHDELCRLTGLARGADMYRHAKNELHRARMGGISADDYEED